MYEWRVVSRGFFRLGGNVGVRKKTRKTFDNTFSDWELSVRKSADGRLRSSIRFFRSHNLKLQLQENRWNQTLSSIYKQVNQIKLHDSLNNKSALIVWLHVYKLLVPHKIILFLKGRVVNKLYTWHPRKRFFSYELSFSK